MSIGWVVLVVSVKSGVVEVVKVGVIVELGVMGL